MTFFSIYCSLLFIKKSGIETNTSEGLALFREGEQEMRGNVKSFFTVIFLLSFLTTLGFGDTRQNKPHNKQKTPEERLIIRNQYGMPILDAGGRRINYTQEQIRMQASQHQNTSAKLTGKRERTLESVTGATATWSYGTFGSCIGEGGMLVDNVGGRQEIYLTGRMHNTAYWNTLHYNKALNNYEIGFVSSNLETYLDEIVSLRLGDVIGDSDKEVLVALRNSDIHIYSQATKKYLKNIKVYTFNRKDLTDLEIADIDNDGQNELIVSTKGHLFVYSGSGIEEWRMDIKNACDIVVGQMDNDIGLEIAVTKDSYYDDGYIIDCASRSIQWTWPNGFGVQVAAADIDNDNREELIENDGWGTIFAYDVERQLPKWSISTDSDIDAIYLDDIDNDSVIELLVGDDQRGYI